MTSLLRFAILSSLCIGSLGALERAQALAITVSAGNPPDSIVGGVRTYVKEDVPCPPHESCKSVAHFSTEALASLEEGLDGWNETRQEGTKWITQDGGPLDATLDVDVFDAINRHAFNHTGGLEIDVRFIYDGADRNDFFWAQGIHANYHAGDPTIVAPYHSLDLREPCDPNAQRTNPAQGGEPDVWCAPLYPFQYTDGRFHDEPTGPFDSAFFEADAVLVKVDAAHRTLIVFGGIEYGFELSVNPAPPPPPALAEPGTALLILAGGVLGVAASRQRRRGSQPLH